jgi:hypothetical protein
MPTKITLPALLEDRLHGAEHEPAVRKALQDFGNWFDESKLTFFPDYTNHGIQHINQVLKTVVNLIPEKSLAAFSKEDGAALILAVLLHDSALHLSKGGFYQLIKGSQPYPHLPFFDRANWGQTWADFMFLARRWDDTMLANVFGQDATGAPRAQVRDPFDHWQNLTETDNLLIGEFIRKHHPRLAHEMALHGVPGPTGIYLDLHDLPVQWRDLVGLVARSHGLPLRTGLEYLKKTRHFGTFAHREYKEVHAVYLMALLRVGDYIQIQGDRTSKLVFQYKDIPSLISQVEHKIHLSDITITDATDDPESLQIDAYPQEVAVFLRLKEWLAGIQQELDSSWAVLGEVYGLQTQTKLNTLGLTFRRVRSNLDDVAEFAKTVPYVPDRIRFDVARAELLKLLIGPLYGDDPSYGVRELMQNAIDAVREYDQFVLDNPQYASVPRREQEADVVVELGPLDEATGYATMTISDRGIGMTELIIKEYFLRAGASYRQSTKWKADFEFDSSKSNEAKILRSGRFGVGALSAFLIGAEIEIHTRHVSLNKGYVFKAQLEDDVLDVRQLENIKVGTEIRILVDRNVYAELTNSSYRISRPPLCDWYCLKYPIVIRKFSEPGKLFRSMYGRYKFDFEGKLNHWRSLSAELPYNVYWTFDEVPTLTCNGFVVSYSRRLDEQFRNRFGKEYGLSLKSLRYPNVAILDRSAHFPITLRRDDLRASDYPFAKELARDFLSEMLCWIFFNGPNSMSSSKINEINLSKWRASGYGGMLAATKKGFGLKLSVLLDLFAIRHLVLYVHELSVSFLSDDTLLCGSSVVRLTDTDFDISTEFVELKFVSKPLYRRKVLFDKKYDDVGFFNLNKGDKLGNFYFESQYLGWLTVCSNVEKTPACEVAFKYPELVFNKHVYNPAFISGDVVHEYFFAPRSVIRAVSKPWLLDELWQEYFGKNWIPFDLKERINKFPDTAKFFAERYPQVVPDEAWALLGGKPAPA